MAQRQRAESVRDHLTAAKRALRAANVQLGRHFMECARCCQARQDVTRYCDAGYALAKVIARSSAAVRRAGDAKRQLPVQGVLV